MKEQLINLIKKEVQGQNAYAAEIADCPIKLDANENPFPMPPSFHREFIKALGLAPLNRYPEPGSPSLLARFAKAYGVATDMMTIGNGSDELIQILCMSMAKAAVLVPTPTFVMYRISALNSGHTVTEVPLNNEFDLDLDAMLERIAA